MLVYLIISFLMGGGVAMLFDHLFKTKHKEKLVNASVPLAALISDFEEFARGMEGGALSADADSAIKLLKTHAEQKFLPPANKVKKFNGFQGKREDEWSDLRCFEKEMEKATSDTERIIIVRHWLQKYNFVQSWQTWCINSLKDSDNRSYMRRMFQTNEG